MPKDTPVFLVGKRITAILVLLGQQVEESGNIPFVDKAAILVHAEELAEIERYVLIGELFEQASEVVGIDVHDGQCCVGIRVALMYPVPFLFGALLHHVVPGVYLVLLEVVQ